MARKSTEPQSIRKPRADFPLFPHATGRWAKKVRGKLHYFGRTDADPRGEKALKLWLDQKDDLLAGRKPRSRSGAGPTVADAINGYLSGREAACETGEITPQHLRGLVTAGKRTARVLGRDRPLSDLRADDFARLKAEIARCRRTLTTLANEIVRTKAPFHWALKSGLVESPVLFGPDFAGPSKGKLRADRRKRRGADWLFTPAEVRQLIDAAGCHLKAMILLAVNGGFGPHDCASLPLSAVDLEQGWIDFPRPKTGVGRRVPLWRETVTAMQASLSARPTPRTDAEAGLFFLTQMGQSWGDGATRFPVSAEFGKLLKRLSLSRHGRGIYCLRHVFRTAASASRDVEAVRTVMGHASEHVEEVYLHSVEDDRLLAVVATVHAWLFGTAEGGAE